MRRKIKFTVERAMYLRNETHFNQGIVYRLCSLLIAGYPVSCELSTFSVSTPCRYCKSYFWFYRATEQHTD